MIKEISNSPGYKISDQGIVYSPDNKMINYFLTSDGYKRVRLPSIRHGKKTNFSIHLLVAEAFLNGGKYLQDIRQVNHINGIKTDNRVKNLELVTGTENVRHAHRLGLYKFDMGLKVVDLKEEKELNFYSIREFARYIGKSLNYTKTRLAISNIYPILNRYRVVLDLTQYAKITKLKGVMTIYVYSHIDRTLMTFNSYSEIAIRLGLPYITINKKLRANKNKPIYLYGYTFSLSKIDIEWKDPSAALKERNELWKKLINN